MGLFLFLMDGANYINKQIYLFAITYIVYWLSFCFVRIPAYLPFLG